MTESTAIIGSPGSGRRERLVVADGCWTILWDAMPGIRAGASGRSVRTLSADARSTDERTAYAEQVHGCDVVFAREAGPAGQADALVTDRENLRLLVRVADCLPVLLAVPGGVAAVHAGWRGAAGGIVGRAMARLLLESGREARDARAWVGPAIGTCCFEVGAEVAGAFPATVRRDGPRRDHVDLAAAVAGQLHDFGLPESAIDISRYCTRCHQHLWHSHRGSGGRPGRLLAWIYRLGQDDSSNG